MTVATRHMTADELFRMPDDDFHYELVRGELKKMSPAGELHGDISLEIAMSLRLYARERKLGKVYGSNVGFILFRDPDTVREPDASFVRAERVVRTPKYFPGAPDLAVEVLSPDDTRPEVLEKITCSSRKPASHLPKMVWKCFSSGSKNVLAFRASASVRISFGTRLP